MSASLRDAIKDGIAQVAANYDMSAYVIMDLLDAVHEHVEKLLSDESDGFDFDEMMSEDDGFIDLTEISETDWNRIDAIATGRDRKAGYVLGALVKDHSPEEIYMLGAEHGFSVGRDPQVDSITYGEAEADHGTEYRAGFLDGLRNG